MRSWDGMSSVCLSVHPFSTVQSVPSVCNIGGWWSCTLEYFENNLSSAHSAIKRRVPRHKIHAWECKVAVFKLCGCLQRMLCICQLLLCPINSLICSLIDLHFKFTNLLLSTCPVEGRRLGAPDDTLGWFKDACNVTSVIDNALLCSSVALTFSD